MKDIVIERQDDVLMVGLQGEVTFENTGDIRQRVESELAAGEHASLILDLSAVTFMDSSGIGTLVALNSKVYNSGKRLYLLSPAEQVLKTLEMVKLTEFFDIIKDESDLDILPFG